MINILYTIADSIRFWLLTVYTLAKTGVVKVEGPVKLFKIAKAWYIGGSSLSLLCSLAAIRDPDGIAIIDDAGELTFAQLSLNSENIARTLHSEFNINAGANVVIMCRNHRDFIQATLACSRLGANLLFINTDFNESQIKQLLTQSSPDMLIYDAEFIPVMKNTENSTPTVITACENSSGEITLSALADKISGKKLYRARQGNITVLTSGTTGLAKGAERRPTLRAVISPFTTLLTKLPLRSGMPSLISIPLFHGFGLAAMATALSLNAPIILRRRFDPTESLTLLNKHKVGAWVVVPTMLHRLLAILPKNSALNDLRAIVSGGAPITTALVLKTLNRLGKKLFNLYGTSEAGFVSIATPDDLTKYPTTVGRKSEGVKLVILDEQSNPVAVEKIGRICVSGRMVFSQYSDGKNDKKISNNFVETGDLGYLNSKNYLFLSGREDSMIISGGENVFPAEVENLLALHPDVEDVAVIPMDDEEFGQRLHAFVIIKSNIVKPNAKLTVKDLKTYLKLNLTRYKMPATISLVETLPRNALGKTNRYLLRPPDTQQTKKSLPISER